jgi:hypothetical protein
MANQRKYEITAEQYMSLLHYRDMFNVHSESVEYLCSGEQLSEILYGFKLGRIYSSLKDHYSEMKTLLSEIEEVEIGLRSPSDTEKNQ